MANLQLTRNLKSYRDAHGYTQEWLSQHLNISRQAYSNYECGKRDPDLDLLIRLCRIYNVTLDELVHQPFASGNMLVCDAKTPYTAAAGKDSEDILYLTADEIILLLKYREADEETRRIIARLLDTK